MNIKTPTNARKEFYELLKQVNDSHEPVIINSSKSENNAVIISQKDWDSIQETLYLESTGTMDKVREREKDNSGYTRRNISRGICRKNRRKLYRGYKKAYSAWCNGVGKPIDRL